MRIALECPVAWELFVRIQLECPVARFSGVTTGKSCADSQSVQLLEGTCADSQSVQLLGSWVPIEGECPCPLGCVQCLAPLPRGADLDFDVRWIRPPVDWGGG